MRKLTKKAILSFLIAVMLCSSNVFAQTISEAEEILDKMYDEYDFGSTDYSCTVTLIVEKPNEPKQQLQYKLFERPTKEQFSMIQIFPEADKGNGYLRDGDNLWFYDPIGRKFSHSSIKENIGDSDAKVSDVTTSHTWRDYYEVISIEEGKLGAYDVWIIAVKSISKDGTYAKEVYSIRKDVSILLKEEDYSSSDRLMRTILFPKYTRVEGKYVATQVIIRDELNKGEQTQQIVSDISLGKLPDRIFTKAYLEQIN